ncbi:L-ribulose-5-phosphate 3-epimerase [uncultured Microbacterium sp.]|uniref:L-ribulose-5-phosphate 3-epimerase n=1 Tax=uncultured Microbacterium sp. TaxID=191216 RepID=UPI0025ECD0B2|nr:L-ribulose-5-phosphate 3-epimerase [uncultured Microbacterium sp.]
MTPASGVALGVYEKALPPISDWDAFFADVSRTGFSFTDLSIDESDERSRRLTWSAAHREGVRAAAARAGVDIGGLCLSLHRRVMPGSVDAGIRARAAEVFRRGIDLAADLGVAVVQVAGYYAHYEPADPGARRRYLDTLAAAVPYAARAGVVLGIENVDGHDVRTIGDAVAIVDEIGSPWLQVYPDIGNVAEHGGDVTAELASARGRILALHVKDARPGEPRRVPFGAGDADFDAAFAELARQRWAGRVLIEMWNDPADARERCVAARAFVAQRLARAGIAVIGGGPGPRTATDGAASVDENPPGDDARREKEKTP